VQTSNTLSKIAPAVVKAQSELKHAVKDSTNSAFKNGNKASKYADLGAVWDAAKPVLTANKLAALQDVVSTPEGMGVRTRLLHESGEWIEFDPPIIPLDRRNAHGAGSVLTYGRRYSLSAALGVVADEDDDGNAASQGNGETHRTTGERLPDPTQGKNPPGISAVKVEVREVMREIHACSDWEQLLALLNERKPLFIKVATIFTNEWTGPDGTGLRGEALKVATQLGNPKAMEAWLSKCEQAKAPIQQAAE